MKKSYIYILIFIFGLFSFSSDVWAAQELTCLYEKGPFSDKVLLIQYKDGKRQIFKHDKDVGIEDGGWRVSEAYTDRFGSDLRETILDENGNLKKCPPSHSTGLDGSIFWAGEPNVITDINLKKLIPDQSYKKIVEPAMTESGEVENDKLDELLKGVACPVAYSDEYSKLWPDGLGQNGLGTSKKGTKFTGACLYSESIDEGCHLVQISFNKNDVEIIEYDPVKGEEYSSDESFNITGLGGSFKYDSGYTGKAILDISNGIGDCISPIRVKRYENYINPNNSEIHTNVYLTGTKGVGYTNVYSKGKTSGTGTKLDIGFSIDIGFEDIKDIDSCEEIFGSEIIKKFKNVWNFVRILVPIILIVLGTLDFSKAVFSGNEDGMKKAQGKFIKRVIIAVAIFVIPSILGLLLNIANSVFGDFGTDICGILG